MKKKQSIKKEKQLTEKEKENVALLIKRMTDEASK